MTDTTAGEIWRLHEKLERDASELLGRAIFSFSRLDVSFGSMVASIQRTSGNDEAVSKVEEMKFHKRIEFLSRFVREAQDIHPSAREAMNEMLKQADELRVQRNRLIHGRWDVDDSKRKVLNIIGLPGSGTQRVIEYSLEELESFVQRTQDLHSGVSKARIRWHLS